MGLDARPFIDDHGEEADLPDLELSGDVSEDARDADSPALEVEGHADSPVQAALEAAEGDADLQVQAALEAAGEIQPLAGAPQQPTPEGNRGSSSTRLPSPRRRVESSPRELPNQFLTRWYPLWEWFTIFWALLLSFGTPFELGFLFVGSTTWLFMLLDSVTTLLGIGDLVLQIYFCQKGIDIPQNKYHKYWQRILTVLDAFGCLPWIVIYEVGKEEWPKYLSILRVFRARKVYFCIEERKDKLKDHFCWGIFCGVLQILFVILFCLHTEGCILYFIATLSSSSQNTWIGVGAPSQNLSSYHHFGRNYLSSLYFATVTFFTIGYGDFHVVNEGEMAFIVIAHIFNFVVVAYLTVRISSLCQRKETEEGGES
ncbi:potassium channel GORK isoform X2 [Ziziphus jujuba]|nr:potassium channel GORK isoform X2 [Ziziphus jujuba]XP_048332551.2 potassium channel GORK isoform X2 [Ziziphus jujuba]